MHAGRSRRDHSAIPSGPGDCLVRLGEFIERHRPLFVLTGAGCSTDSGIPAYRDVNGDWKHTKPVQIQEFIQHHSVRQRYWARSMLGWPRVFSAEPNAAHRALASMEHHNLVNGLVTQNVDGLHHKAGQQNLIDLHGNLIEVRCMGCNLRDSRAAVQSRLESANPGFTSLNTETIPDGHTCLGSVDLSTFEVPCCTQCGGIVRPDVVFFGESVPKPRVEHAFRLLKSSPGMLVVGSSLVIFSGFRFCRFAAENEIPMAAINLGRTRADDMFTVKASMNCASALSNITNFLIEPTLL